jgi:hypothetical protein
MRMGLIAPAAGSFGIGLTKFVINGLPPEVAPEARRHDLLTARFPAPGADAEPHTYSRTRPAQTHRR